MKNLMVFASAVIVGSAVLAGTTPRVYEYSACLNTAVAKNAAKVTYLVGTTKVTDLDVCYRAKGKVDVKGVIVLGCDCYEFTNAPMATPYPIVLMATSADKYSQVVFADGEYSWVANRLGDPISSKAKDAELGFETAFRVGPTNGCDRLFVLWNAGFGSASVLDSGDKTLDIASISGNVTGFATAPFCSAAENNCPRCQRTGTCQPAIAFVPCAFSDPYDYAGVDMGVAYGTFSLKFNSNLSKAIKPVQSDNVQGTINALVPKVFGSKAVAPTYVPPPPPEEP